MTRARFAQVTGLGEASLNRWENGLTIQTRANDRYLRLLAYPEVMRQLEEVLASETPSEASMMGTCCSKISRNNLITYQTHPAPAGCEGRGLPGIAGILARGRCP